MGNNQRLTVQQLQRRNTTEDANNLGYHPDGFDVYLAPSPNYNNITTSYLRNNQTAGPYNYDFPDSTSYYDENSSRFNAFNGASKLSTTPLQNANLSQSPVDKLYDRFSFNNMGYNDTSSSTNRSPAPSQQLHTAASAAYLSKRSISQSSALEAQTYTTGAGHLKIPSNERVERKTKSVPDLSYPCYNQNSNDYVKTKGKTSRSGPFSAASKKPVSTLTQQQQQQQQQQHMYYDTATTTKYGCALPNDHEYTRYYHDDAYPQQNMEMFHQLKNKYDVTKYDQVPTEMLPQQHYFSYPTHDALQVENTYEMKPYILEGQQQYLYPVDIPSENKENFWTMQANSVAGIKQYVV